MYDRRSLLGHLPPTLDCKPLKTSTWPSGVCILGIKNSAYNMAGCTWVKLSPLLALHILFLIRQMQISLITPQYRLSLVLAVLFNHRKSHFSPLQRHAWVFMGFYYVSMVNKGNGCHSDLPRSYMWAGSPCTFSSSVLLRLPNTLLVWGFYETVAEESNVRSYCLSNSTLIRLCHQLVTISSSYCFHSWESRNGSEGPTSSMRKYQIGLSPGHCGRRWGPEGHN